jgi:FtsH-binding integral membrane protein
MEEGMEQTNTVSTTSEATKARINTFLAQVYLLMTLGLVVTGFTASWVNNNLNLQLRIATNPWIGWGLFIIQIVIVVALSGAAPRMSAGLAALMFLLYSALVGVTISTIFLIYSGSDVSYAFWVSAGMFLLTSLAGLLLKRDLSGAGNFLLMVLLGWILAWFFSFFFANPGINWLLNFIGILLFAALTVRDTQRLKQIGEAAGDSGSLGRVVVVGALTLYLDFINLFLLLLRATSR